MNKLNPCPCDTAQSKMKRIMQVSKRKSKRIAELEYIMEQFKGGMMLDCPFQFKRGCMFPEARAKSKLCLMHGSESTCWIEYYRREFRAKKGGKS